MFIFTDFVGSQLKESFAHYKRLRLQNEKKEMTDIMHQDLIKVKFKTNKNLKNMKLSDNEIIGLNTNSSTNSSTPSLYTPMVKCSDILSDKLLGGLV